MSLEARPSQAMAGEVADASCLAAAVERPGGIDAVAEQLGSIGVEVVGSGIPTTAANLAENIVLDLTRPIDLPLIEHTLRPIGRKILALRAI